MTIHEDCIGVVEQVLQGYVNRILSVYSMLLVMRSFDFGWGHLKQDSCGVWYVPVSGFSFKVLKFNS